ncbi:MAG TPA: DUF4386 domain-containing protein [Candidatus Cybelea sp.]|nr:DUF4386 domain-containing protein [Candidatus Cybelea sp.]
MSTPIVKQRKAERSPALLARLAGLFYLLSVFVAVLAEFVVRGRLGFAAAVLLPVTCYVVVTLLLYAIFEPVSRSVAALAVVFNLVGLTFEALEWQPRGVNIAMEFHGLYCLLIGYLIFRSTFLPRILGALVALAGLVWLVYLSPPLAKYVFAYKTAVGLLGEALPMLWLLVMGVNAQRWREQAGGASE